jgi:hypothetical protein
MGKSGKMFKRTLIFTLTDFRLRGNIAAESRIKESLNIFYVQAVVLLFF